jgi:hypothetical protein
MQLIAIKDHYVESAAWSCISEDTDGKMLNYISDLLEVPLFNQIFNNVLVNVIVVE